MHRIHIEHFTKIRDTQALNDKILKADLDIYLKQSSLRIVLSLLLKENILIYDDNDEIVLELFINRENSKGMVDLSWLKRIFFLQRQRNKYLSWKHSLFGRINVWFYKEYY